MSQLNREIFELREDVFHEDERRASATAKRKRSPTCSLFEVESIPASFKKKSSSTTAVSKRQSLKAASAVAVRLGSGTIFLAYVKERRD